MKSEEYNKKLKELRERIRNIECIKYTINSVLYWDKITYMPKGGIDFRSRVMGYFGELLYKEFNDTAMKELLDYFENNSDNDEIVNRMVHRINRNSNYVSKIPERKYAKYIELVSNSESVWQRAREDRNYEMFLPYLEKLVFCYREFAEYWGWEEDPYDSWISYHEEGFSTDEIGKLIGEIKPQILEIIRDENWSKHVDSEDELPSVPIHKQLELSRRILRDMGFDFNRGRIDLSDHPTILSNSPGDVRLVTHLRDDDYMMGIFNCLHSGGKGLYEQDIDTDLMGRFLAEVSSFAVEEGVGEYYENIIGRSQGFWEYICDISSDILPKEEIRHPRKLFLRANKLQSTAIRLESDEFSYMMHIIIRYEIERALINGKILPKELPDAWREKHLMYLGVEPKNEREGVLQDIHWASGYFGYFPSYVIASAASAQFASAIANCSSGFNSIGVKQQFEYAHSWLKNKVHRYGAMYETSKLIEISTGEPLNGKFYVDHLNNKRRDIDSI